MSSAVFFDELVQEYNARRVGVVPDHRTTGRPVRRLQCVAAQADAGRGLAGQRRLLVGDPARRRGHGHSRRSPAPPDATYAGSSETSSWKGVAADVKRLALALSTTPATVYATAMACVYHRYSGSEDVIFGMPNANRGEIETERTIGFFINMLPLRCPVAPDETFQECLARSSSGCAALRRTATFRLRRSRHTNVQRDSSRSTLLQYTLTINEWTDQLQLLDGVSLTGILPETTRAKFFQQWTLNQADEDLDVNTVYNTDIFDLATIQAMQRVFVGFLRRALATPDVSMQRLWDSDEEARALQGHLGVGTRTPAPTGSVFAHFRDVVDEHEHRVAVSTPTAQLTYGQLLRRVDQLRAHLSAAGVGAGSRVGVALDRRPTSRRPCWPSCHWARSTSRSTR